MATRPPRKPLIVIPMSHFLMRGYTANMATRAPAEAANVVLVATRPIPAAARDDRVVPGLNAYQPDQRITPPMAAIVRSCPGGTPPPSRLNFRPKRGPSTMAPVRATIPPTV